MSGQITPTEFGLFVNGVDTSDVEESFVFDDKPSWISNKVCQTLLYLFIKCYMHSLTPNRVLRLSFVSTQRKAIAKNLGLYQFFRTVSTEQKQIVIAMSLSLNFKWRSVPIFCTANLSLSLSGNSLSDSDSE